MTLLRLLSTLTSEGSDSVLCDCFCFKKIFKITILFSCIAWKEIHQGECWLLPIIRVWRASWIKTFEFLVLHRRNFVKAKMLFRLVNFHVYIFIVKFYLLRYQFLRWYSWYANDNRTFISLFYYTKVHKIFAKYLRYY